jgi:hypothetical protein
MFICIILRYRFLLKEDPHRSNYEPLNGAIRIFNEFSDLFEFGGSRDGFRIRIKERDYFFDYFYFFFFFERNFCLRILFLILVFL